MYCIIWQKTRSLPTSAIRFSYLAKCMCCLKTILICVELWQEIIETKQYLPASWNKIK